MQHELELHISQPLAIIRYKLTRHKTCKLGGEKTPKNWEISTRVCYEKKKFAKNYYVNLPNFIPISMVSEMTHIFTNFNGEKY